LDLGPVSVLVNNAGNDERHKADEISVEYWDDRIAVNLRHQFFAAREVARDMKENGGGSIINFGSVQAYLSSPGMSGYAVSKYGVRGVTRTLAREFGKNNIRVNTVVPGWVMTERQKELWVDEAAEKMIDEVQCLPGRLQPSDVARLVLFLASDDSAMCTAQDFIVDAGWV
jgi:NAD(P)-dependent dehydrogenase (short-subunit alcohol dehydrogenase family)